MSNICNSVERILIIGLGSIGKRHARIIKELFPEIKIIALRHKIFDSSDVDSLGLYDCVDSIEKAMLLNPDAAIVANPSSLRLNIMKSLANAGVHILAEKPISATTDGIQDLINLCSAKGVVLMTGYNLRFLPSLIKFREKIQTGKVGKILSFQVEVSQNLLDWRPNIDYKKTVSSQKKLGGGVLLELSHEIDYINWIFGKIKWVKSHVSRQSDLEIDVEDHANIIFGFKNQDDYETIGHLNMNFYQYDPSRNCKVVGDRGTLLWDGLSGEIKFYGRTEKKWKTVFSSSPIRDFTYTSEIQNFLTAINSNEEPLVSGDDGLLTLQVINAIHQSSEQEKIIYL